jgi:hypothetical protein
MVILFRLNPAPDPKSLPIYFTILDFSKTLKQLPGPVPYRLAEGTHNENITNNQDNYRYRYLILKTTLIILSKNLRKLASVISRYWYYCTWYRHLHINGTFLKYRYASEQPIFSWLPTLPIRQVTVLNTYIDRCRMWGRIRWNPRSWWRQSPRGCWTSIPSTTCHPPLLKVVLQCITKEFTA